MELNPFCLKGVGFDREGYAYFERWVGLKGEGSDTDKKMFNHTGIPVSNLHNTYVSEKYYVVKKKKKAKGCI